MGERINPDLAKTDIAAAFDFYLDSCHPLDYQGAKVQHARALAFLAQVEADCNKQAQLCLALGNLILAVQRWEDDPEFLDRAVQAGRKVLDG